MSNKEEREMELLSAYLDDELDTKQKEQVSSFLARSPEGRRAVEELRNTKSLFAAFPRITAPTDFLDKLEAQAETFMEQQARQQSFWNWANPWAWTSLTATASAAAVALMIGIHSPRQISYEVLLAAHENAQVGGGVHQTLMSAATGSSLYNTSQNAKA
jgi:anti-sigma factor RsiW